MSVESYQLYIDGKWVSTPDSYEIRSPATEELVATVAKGGVEHVDAAVAAARRAHESGVWRNTSPEDRANLLLDVAERLGAKADQLAALQTRENGATIRITGALHIGLSIAQLQFLAVQSKDYEYETAGPAIEPIPAEGIVRREPVGVVAAIVPWNIPYLTTIWKIAPALAAGNTVVLKPDEHAPLCGLELAKVFDEAGLPAGVLNVVTGDGEPVGKYLAGHPGVNKVAFTGSTVVGKSILRDSADTVKRVSLELGGKGPNIILDGADLDTAIDGSIFAAFANNGEACEAGTRLLVPRERHDEIVDRLVERAATLRVGDPLDPATNVGPVISETQQSRILEYFRIAAAEGAKAVLGGGVPAGPQFEKGYWIEPTVFVGVDNSTRIAREEVFGPVVVVLPYDSIDDAVKIANDSDYGLSAGVWGDEATAREVANRLDAGMVFVNDWHVIHPAYPFGGFKQSGLGREGGLHQLDEYTEAKFVSVNKSPGPEARAFAIVIDPA
ncbi:putative aldehyde dehydrogenase [Gordonia polyisoprenivorans NBRC 16320 = JCM 10675]|uniref:Aldehyde dehydrogenase family protein n=2 Tax=Gordonia polyisoprenivorans TaxID=84595 RepID=A0A846WUL2_9ACTN|nr:aldehyde dehydrogenase family protein [Gordonia polyisoprenivorans]NKY05185.1 aldehyde dehydrogenase family protein [Gordonia polyisoprenivorans]GAB24078.1 putative aldehyde dehydrogenase [Gordonia polyisoprenivorans NBRC 16320 = JCM 10675]